MRHAQCGTAGVSGVGLRRVAGRRSGADQAERDRRARPAHRARRLEPEPARHGPEVSMPRRRTYVPCADASKSWRTATNRCASRVASCIRIWTSASPASVPVARPVPADSARLRGRVRAGRRIRRCRADGLQPGVRCAEGVELRGGHQRVRVVPHAPIPPAPLPRTRSTGSAKRTTRRASTTRRRPRSARSASAGRIRARRPMRC